MTDQEQSAVTVYGGKEIAEVKKSHPFSAKMSLTQRLRGGVIVDVSSVNQAKIAESAGVCSVIVSELLRPSTGVIRMPDPALVKEVKRAVSIPVMARARVGHFVEAQILESAAVDCIDESEVISVADEENFINKHNFAPPFVCGCRNTGEALRRIREGAAMIRIQGEVTETGNISETVKNIRTLMGEVRLLNNMDDDEVYAFAKDISAPYDLVAQTKNLGKIPVIHYAAGGITTPADAALMMQLGCDGVFIGPEIFNNPNPFKKISNIVQAVIHYNNPQILAEMSTEIETGTGSLSITIDRIQDVTHENV